METSTAKVLRDYAGGLWKTASAAQLDQLQAGLERIDATEDHGIKAISDAYATDSKYINPSAIFAAMRLPATQANKQAQIESEVREAMERASAFAGRPAQAYARSPQDYIRDWLAAQDESNLRALALRYAKLMPEWWRRRNGEQGQHMRLRENVLFGQWAKTQVTA